jgi:ABC-2 type transport system ATP-binding protein
MPDELKPVVRVDSVSKSFRLPTEQVSGLKQALLNAGRHNRGSNAQQVLKDVSFDIEPGEFFGIVGRNGSGKSTLLKLLAGIYVPDNGRIHIDGSLTPFIELGVGFNPELTGRENVFLNGALLGFSRDEMQAMYADIVTFAELEKFMDQKLKNYSSGMQVRLAFSIAIRAKSDILLIDEVLAVGDAAFQQKCFDYFEELRSEKQTIILVTHDMSAVKRFCDRALLISAGKIELIGSPEQVADLYTEKNIDNVSTDEKTEASRFVKAVFPKKRQFKKSDTLEFEIGLKNTVPDDDYFISVSFVSAGFVFANKNSKYNDSSLSLSKNNSLRFTQELNGFNEGKFDIHLSLHKKSNDVLVEHQPRAFSFVVTGRDVSRDGPMRIEGGWSNVERAEKQED